MLGKRSLERIIEDMEEIKRAMAALVEKKLDLLDPEVLKVSKRLDALLNEYYRRVRSDAPKGAAC